ncbi:hypothetical protein SRABI106_04587 [Rahnella aquatilis]|nr:hypothetical protein SRABI106_04587 [Rahnella aquatilis]
MRILLIYGVLSDLSGKYSGLSRSVCQTALRDTDRKVNCHTFTVSASLSKLR